MYILRLGKWFKCSKLRSFAVHLKLNFSPQSFAATPILIFACVQSKHVVNNVGVLQKGLGCVVGCLISQSSDAKSKYM